jgi:3-hydroxy-9,10-secoandrosta-1,3,5(10)-triene-9,17-dione monooxygenase reductase component
MMENFDSKHFRAALGQFVTGVTVVTTIDAAGNPVGLTANSFNAVSLTPPMVLWSLDKKSSNLQSFMDSDRFAINILSDGQRDVATRFATRGIDRFEGVETYEGPAGLPLIQHCAAHFECKTAHRYEGGDHIIFVGEVLSCQRYVTEPLGFHAGQFVQVERAAA